MTPSAIHTLGPRTRVPAAVAAAGAARHLVALQGCDVVTADLKHSETAEWRKTYELAPGGRVADQQHQRQDSGRTVDREHGRGRRAEDRQGGKRRKPRRKRSSGSRSARKSPPRASASRPSCPGAAAGSRWATRRSNTRCVSRSAPRSSSRRSTAASKSLASPGRVIAETTNGGVSARDISGTIEASTTNGGVDVELTRLGEGGAKLECTNGGIRLRLPADAKASISASITNGGIDSSGLSIETTEKSRRRLEGRLNGGGAPDPPRWHERRHYDLGRALASRQSGALGRRVLRSDGACMKCASCGSPRVYPSRLRNTYERVREA